MADFTHVLPFLFSLALLLQYSSPYGINEETMATYRERVKEMFGHAYDSYMKYAYPLDELQPLTCTGKDTWGSFSLSLIDSMDTLLAMGNITEFQRAYNNVISKPSFDIDVNTSVFEANIRVLGGLLSSHLLSHIGKVPLAPGWPCEGPLLAMAESLARRLLPAFDTPTGLPYGTVNLRYGVPMTETPVTCTACCTSYLVEFGTLSRLTGDPIYEETALKAVKAIWSRRSSIGLPGNHINVITGAWTATDFSMGNYIDSYLEYLVKGGALLGHGELLDMFKELLVPIKNYTEQNGWYLWVNMDSGKVTFPFFEALDSYWPGLLSLVGELEEGKRSIFNHYMVWRTLGSLPEILNIIEGVPRKGYEAYRLRPELAESIWYLYQMTGNPFLIQMGQSMVEAIDKISRVECGFATVRNCLDHTLSDRMESYFLAETLKYLYLLFDPKNFMSPDPTLAVNVSETLSVPGGHQILHNKQLLRDGCSVGRSGYIFSTEAHPIDVGALYCCRRKQKVGGSNNYEMGGDSKDVKMTKNDEINEDNKVGKANEGDGVNKVGGANEEMESRGITSQDGCIVSPFKSRFEMYTGTVR